MDATYQKPLRDHTLIGYLNSRKPIKQRANVDMTRYCDYHKAHDHTTDHCTNLEDVIEEYVNNGKLEHLVKNIRGVEKRNNGHEGERSGKKIKDLHVNMIQGGTKGRKRPEAEYALWKEEQVIFPHVKGGANKKAPLVINVVFGHYRTSHFFIDAGTTSDTMYRQCFGNILNISSNISKKLLL